MNQHLSNGKKLATREQIVSLIHHVELNKAGWWDRGVQQLVAAILWLKGEPLRAEEIVKELVRHFSMAIDLPRLIPQIGILRANGTLIELSDGGYKLSERSRAELDDACVSAEKAEQEAKESFLKGLKGQLLSLTGDEVWNRFNGAFLLPLIRDMGAQTYEMISGETVAARSVATKSFLDGFPSEARPVLRDAIISFIDPKNAAARSYMLQYMNNFLFVQASNLSDDTIKALSEMAEEAHEFSLLVDTNFLFSILGLHENPSNEPAIALQALIAQLSGKLNIKLFVSPDTVDETRRVIGFHKDDAAHLRMPTNVSAAVLKTNKLRGIVRKFITESYQTGGRLKAEDYFGPYLRDLVGILKRKGVELFNEDTDPISLRQDVIDDIDRQLIFEKRFGERAKSYEALRHDIALWHFVRAKRPLHVESLLDARYWIVTIDFRLLGFDAFKRRKAAHLIPVCVHPLTLIQLFQFWIPRTPEFEEALLGNLRLPFLFHEFSPEAEKATIRILEVLSRFENVRDLSEDAVYNILVNDALRVKLSNGLDEEAQIELVKEALIEEEKKAREQLVATQSQLASERSALLATEASLRRVETELLSLQKAADVSSSIRGFLRGQVIIPVALTLGGGHLFAFGLARLVSIDYWMVVPAVSGLMFCLFMERADRAGLADQHVSETPVFRMFHQWKVWLFWLVGTILLGIFINASWDVMKPHVFSTPLVQN